MNNPVDQRGKLQEEVFSYQISKDNKVFIFWNDRQVMILKGKESERFLRKAAAADSFELQLIMAKVTGNFKRGNEKAKKKR